MELKDLQKGYKMIECEQFKIAAACEAEFGENELTDLEIYYPATFLIYIEKGALRINSDLKTFNFSKGDFCLVRKYTYATYSKIFTKEERQAKSYSFALPNEFIRKIISGVRFDKDLEPIGERVLHLNGTLQLRNIMKSIKGYVDNGINLDADTLQTNVEEALTAIVNSDSRMAIVFKEFSLAERADLDKFMNSNFLLKLPLEEFAFLSGRSLSTFNREFKLIFNITPHKWLRRKRLNTAYSMLLETNKRIGDVCWESSFENLAHFSKSFKKEFGIAPSKLRWVYNRKEKNLYIPEYSF